MKSVLTYADFNRDVAPFENHPLSLWKGIREIVQNADDQDAKNVLLTPICYRNTEYLVIANDGNLFSSEQQMRDALNPSMTGGKGKGSQGAGGKAAHKLFSSDGYSSEAIWCGHTEDGKFASFLLKAVRERTNIISKIAGKEQQELQECLSKLDKEEISFNTYILIKTDRFLSKSRRHSPDAIFFDQLSVFLSPSKVKVWFKNYSNRKYDIVSRDKWLNAVGEYHRVIELKDVECYCLDKFEASVTGTIRVHIFDGYCYENENVTYRLVSVDGGGKSAEPRSTTNIDMEGIFTASFVEDPGASRVHDGCVYVAMKFLHDVMNQHWRTNIFKVKKPIPTERKYISSQTEKPLPIQRKPQVFVEIDIKNVQNVSNIQNNKKTLLDQRSVFGEILPIDKFFYCEEKGKNNLRVIADELIKSAKNKYPEEIQQIVTLCKELFPSCNNSDMANLPQPFAGNLTKVHMMKDGNPLPYMLIPGQNYEVDYFAVNGKKIDGFFRELGQDFTINPSDDGYNVLISKLKVKNADGKFVACTDEEWTKSDLETIPHRQIKMVDAKNGTQYQITHEIETPSKYTKSPNTRSSLQPEGDNNKNGQSRWFESDHDIFARINGDVISYNKRKIELKRLFSSTNPEGKLSMSQKGILEEMESMIWTAHNNAKKDINEIDYRKEELGEIYKSPAVWAGNQAINSFMSQPKIKSKLKMNEDEDIEDTLPCKNEILKNKVKTEEIPGNDL